MAHFFSNVCHISWRSGTAKLTPFRLQPATQSRPRRSTHCCMAKLVTARQLRWFGFGFPFDPFLHVSTWPCYSMHLQFKSHLSMFADTQIVTKEPTEKTGPSTAQALILLYSSTHVFWALPGLQYCTHNLRFGAFQIGFSITIQLKRATPHDIWEPPVEPLRFDCHFGESPQKTAPQPRFLMPWELCNATVMYSDGNGLSDVRA